MRMEQRKRGVDVILFNPGDHPRQTPLCAGQGHYYDRMERETLSNMVDADEDYMDYFRATR